MTVGKKNYELQLIQGDKNIDILMQELAEEGIANAS